MQGISNRLRQGTIAERQQRPKALQGSAYIVQQLRLLLSPGGSMSFACGTQTALASPFQRSDRCCQA
jgi:hypothetical protein